MAQQKKRKLQDSEEKAKKNGPLKLNHTIKTAFLKSPVTSLVVLGVAVGLAINILLAGYVWQKFVLGERYRQLAQIVEQNARVGAGNVANYVHSVNMRLNLFTQSSLLSETLQQKDQVALLEFQNALQKKFPQARAIRLFSEGDAVLDKTSDPPIRFSELEIIRKVE